MTEVIIAILIVLGAFLFLITAIGLVRFKDLYSRLHAITKATSLGILLITLGVALFFKTWEITIKSIIIITFIYITAPLAAHSIAKSFRDLTNSRKNL